MSRSKPTDSMLKGARPSATRRRRSPSRAACARSPRTLPPRPRHALSAHGQARAGPGAPDHRDDDVPRDGHDVLAGEGGGGDDKAGRIDRPQAWTSYLTHPRPRAIVAKPEPRPGAWRC